MKAFFWLAGLAFGLGVYAHQVRRLEERAAAEIASQLGGAERRVDVRAEADPLSAAFGDVRRVTIRASTFTTDGLPLYTEPWRSQRGRIGELRLELGDFVLCGLRIERLEATIPSCRFDLPGLVRRHEMRLSRSGEGTGEVTVLADDLARFLVEKFHEIQRASVRIEKDKVFVSGFGEFVIVKAEFDVIARLVAVDGRKLALADARIYFDDRRADAAARRALLDTLNPVIDVDEDLGLDGAFDIEGLRLRDGVLRAHGRTRIPTAR